MNNTRVLLYNITHKEDMPSLAFVPLAYTFLSTYLKQRDPSVEVVRYDYKLNSNENGPLAEAPDFDIVGIQLTYPNSQTALEMVDEWAALDSKPFVVVGGVLASAIAFQLLEAHPGIDAVVIGEGEETLCELVRVVRGEVKLSNVQGIVYLEKNGSPTYNPGKRPIDLDDTPIADRSFLGELSRDEIVRAPIRVQTARGCMGGCSFCMNSHKNRLDKVTTKAWRGMSPERTVREIEQLYHDYGVRIINFVDPSFEDPGKKGKRRVKEIAELLIEKDLRISFKINMRADTINDDDIELLRLLKRAGMDVVILGVEACNDKELKLFGKNANSETITKAYWRLKKLDCFFVLVGYISVHPYSSIQSLRSSYDYLRQINQTYSFDIFSNVLISLRGTNIYDKMLADGLIDNPDEILSLAKYRFVDSRVQTHTEGIQRIKVNFPIFMDLHKTIHEGLNVFARSTNRIYEGLLEQPGIHDEFLKFKAAVDESSRRIGKKYYELAHSMLDMAEGYWSFDALEDRAKSLVLPTAEECLQSTRDAIDTYKIAVRNAGYDTGVMDLKPWGSYCQEKMKVGT